MSAKKSAGLTPKLFLRFIASEALGIIAEGQEEGAS